MAATSTTTAAAYLKSLPADRREAIGAVRDVILASLPKGYVESIAYGMLAYEVPLATYPDTYNDKPLMYAALASQKSHMAIYLCSVYCAEPIAARFRAGFAAAGKRLDMGKSCVRFKKLDELALDAVADAIRALPVKAYVEHAKAAHSIEAKAARKATRAKTAKKTPQSSSPAGRSTPKRRIKR